MSGTESLVDMAKLLQNLIGFLYMSSTFLLLVFGWSLFLFIPLFSYMSAYNNFKTEAERGNVQAINSSLLHVKSAFVAIAALTLSSLVFTFIFKVIIGLDSDIASIVSMILQVDKAF